MGSCGLDVAYIPQIRMSDVTISYGKSGVSQSMHGRPSRERVALRHHWLEAPTLSPKSSTQCFPARLGTAVFRDIKEQAALA